VSGRFLEPSTSILESFYAEGKVNSITLKGLVDTSDYSVDPTKGWRNSISLEQAGSIFGGERDYTKYRLDIRRYVPVGKNVFAARAVYGISVGDLPLFDAFVAGGADTLRGFAEDRFWGRKTLLVNTEYRIPLGKKGERKQQVVGFLDFGDAFGGVWRTPDGSAVYPAEHQQFSPRWGYGVGMRFNVGVGFMRLDFGLSREGEQTYFSFGHMF
jgi:outer membrane protein insertion porin family